MGIAGARRSRRNDQAERPVWIPRTQRMKWPPWHVLEIFLYLQVLDVMSTLIGFSLGNTEASPFIRLLIRWGPLTGLICSKVFAIGLAAVCIVLERSALL